MARNNLTELSSNAAENTDVQGVNINEGMSPGGVNNAMRAITAMLADAFALTTPNTKLKTVKAEKLLAADDGDVVQIGTTSPTTIAHSNTALTTTIDAERNLTLEVGTQQNAGTLKIEEHDATLGKITVVEQSNSAGLVVGNTTLNAQRTAAGDTTPAMTVQGTMSATTFIGDGSQLTGVAVGPTSTFPVGGIVMWAGSTVPSGWALCDGQNGTPNLIDKFIMGATASGATGGANSKTLTTNEIPAHSHAAGTIGASHVHTFAGSGSHSHSAGTLAIGNHTHSVGSEAISSHNHSFSSAHTHTITGGNHRHSVQIGKLPYLVPLSNYQQSTYSILAAASSTGSSHTFHSTYTDPVPSSTNSGTASGTTGNASVSVSGSTGNPTNTSLSGATGAATVNVSGTTGAASMSGTSDSAGGGSAFDNRPAYYAMAFIQFKGS